MKNLLDNHHLTLELARVTEVAAIASSRDMGYGTREHADQLATEAMRETLNCMEIHGRIVIGEGERDQAPMLYIGEEVGLKGDQHALVDIAVDPLEGTNLVALGAEGAITVMAMAERGGILHAPDIYMNKLIVGPQAAGMVSIDAPVAENLSALAKSLHRTVAELVVLVLDRPRHETLIAEIRAAGSRIKLVRDGDLLPGVMTAIRGTGIHAVINIGAAPEGVLTAAALKCIGGFMEARFVIRDENDRQRLQQAGVSDPERVWHIEDLVPGEQVLFSATGVTTGDLLTGVRFFGGNARTHTLLTTTHDRSVRFMDTVHRFKEDESRILLR